MKLIQFKGWELEIDKKKTLMSSSSIRDDCSCDRCLNFHYLLKQSKVYSDEVSSLLEELGIAPEKTYRLSHHYFDGQHQHSSVEYTLIGKIKSGIDSRHYDKKSRKGDPQSIIDYLKLDEKTNIAIVEKTKSVLELHFMLIVPWLLGTPPP